jgi:hypothetical protein
MPSVHGFIKALSQVDGFPCSYEDLLRFAEQIPKESGFKPAKSRGGVRAKTAYNVWCERHWLAHCIKEYGKSLPLADVKDKATGEIKINAHTDLRREMYAAFQKTEDYEILKKEVEALARNEKELEKLKILKKEVEEDNNKLRKSAHKSAFRDSHTHHKGFKVRQRVKPAPEKPNLYTQIRDCQQQLNSALMRGEFYEAEAVIETINRLKSQLPGHTTEFIIHEEGLCKPWDLSD